MTAFDMAGLARCGQADTDVAKPGFAKTVTGYDVRCYRTGAASARVLGRHRGSARTDFYYVLRKKKEKR